ncbi:DUF641 family protein (DUF641) [Rhynchospora pubera]|uniref:DUF641 family protein (DUF641) n=1 Tax=Rhynchospora pubera TaxID=906938 RepID=A0AAV8C5Y8_9POAL|nr:DUF641 family protein (DUF641) [Rhynchospora pubera]
MESVKPAAPPNLGSLAKTFNKILKLRRGGGGMVSGVAADETDSIDKLKLSANLDKLYKPNPEISYLERRRHREALEALVANLFASVSAIKAAYTQLQSAQSPYHPDTIQVADQAVVSELKKLSELKHSYLKNQLEREHISPLTAHLREQESLVKTYEVTMRKFEAEAGAKEKQLLLLENEWRDLEMQTRALDMRLHPGRTLSALDGLHMSGLNPTHFLAALRCTVKSVRSFVKTMVKEMETAGWDVTAAARAVHPGVRLLKTSHRRHFFESYVCQKMFSNFHYRDFNLSFLDERSGWDPHRFFEEFTVVKSLKTKQLLDGKDARWEGFGKFCRAKYLSVVHPKMESSFFGRLEQRALVSAGPGFPNSAWFAEFAEMARRVWLLHCLFFSFEEDWQLDEEVGPIFQVRRGSRFSEVYMESVAEEGEDERPSTVGFTVVPGFRVEKTLIQCRVYLADSARRMGPT